jgi:hypothetical protein
MKKDTLRSLIVEQLSKTINENEPKFKIGDNFNYMGNKHTVLSDNGFAVKAQMGDGTIKTYNYSQLKDRVTENGGTNILELEPFNMLPPTRKEMGDYKTRVEIKIPDLGEEDGMVTIFSKQDMEEYISKFKSLYNEEPKFIDLKVDGRFGRANISNPKFKEWRSKSIKGSWIQKDREQGNTKNL